MLSDELGRHVLPCATGGGCKKIHDAVKHQVAVFAREGGYDKSLEVIGGMPLREGEWRIPDLVCQDTVGTKRLVAGHNGRGSSLKSVASTTAAVRGQAAELAAQAKIRKYSNPHPGETFVPLEVEVFGTQEGAFDKFLQKFAGLASLQFIREAITGIVSIAM